MGRYKGHLRPTRDNHWNTTTKVLLVRRHGINCWLCQTPINFDTFGEPDSASIEHVKPIRLGGSDNLSNLRLTHAACNYHRDTGRHKDFSNERKGTSHRSLREAAATAITNQLSRMQHELSQPTAVRNERIVVSMFPNQPPQGGIQWPSAPTAQTAPPAGGAPPMMGAPGMAAPPPPPMGAPFNPGMPQAAVMGWNGQAAGAPQRNTPTEINDNDPYWQSALEFDAEADANAALPPVLPSELVFGNLDQGYTVYAVPAGEGKWMQNKSPKTGIPYAYIDLHLIIVDCVKAPQMNGRRVKFRASTAVSAYSNTSSCQRLIQAVPNGMQIMRTLPKTPLALRQAVNHIVQSAMRFRTNVDWEASLRAEGVEKSIRTVRGWHNFPKVPDGSGMPQSQIQERDPQYGVITGNAFMVANLITADAPKGAQQVVAPTHAFTPMAQAPQTQPQFAQAPTAQVTQQPQFTQQPPNMGAAAATPAFGQPPVAPASAPQPAFNFGAPPPGGFPGA